MKTLENNDTSSESEEGADLAVCRSIAKASWSRVPPPTQGWHQWSHPGVSIIIIVFIGFC